jgi:hypothetical protein
MAFFQINEKPDPYGPGAMLLEWVWLMVGARVNKGELEVAR